MSVTAVILARLQGGRSLNLRPGLTDPTGPLLQALLRAGGRAQQAELCAPASWEEVVNLQIPEHTRRLPSAHKLLLIKPVHLIIGRTIKYVSRCFRSSLWVLVKAAEASDQGCWLCSAAAWSPLSWTLSLQVPRNPKALICFVA